jgi:hypothetical protein
MNKLHVFVSWLPIGKASSHLAVISGLAANFKNVGYELVLCATGINVNHHRGTPFMHEHNESELVAIFKNAIQQSSGVNSCIPNIKVFTCQENRNSADSSKIKLRRYGLHEISESDIILYVSGSLRCPYSVEEFKHLSVLKMVAMMNINDNVTHYHKDCQSCIVPTISEEVIMRIESQGFNKSRIMARNIGYAVPFSQLNAASPAPQKEALIINRLSSCDIVLIFISSRFGLDDLSYSLSILKATQHTMENKKIAICIIGCSQIDDPSLATMGKDVVFLDWSDNIYRFIFRLSQEAIVIYPWIHKSDSGGSLVIAAQAGALVISTFDNDAAPFLPVDHLVHDTLSYKHKLLSKLGNNKNIQEFQSVQVNHLSKVNLEAFSKFAEDFVKQLSNYRKQTDIHAMHVSE